MRHFVVLVCSLAAPFAAADPLNDEGATAPSIEQTARVTPDAGAKGLTFSVPSGGGPTFGVAYFMSDSASLRVDVGLALQSQPQMTGDRTNTGGFSIETGYRMYRPMVGKMSVFLQPSVYLAKTPGVDFGDALSAAFTASFGVEYWLSPQWSLSGSTGLALQAKADMTGSFGTISLTTGTSALSASFYWK